MSDQVFQPEVWSRMMRDTLRSNLVVVSWNQPADRTPAEKAARVEAYRVREAQRQADLANMEIRLKTFPDILQPVITLHARDGHQCAGCDVDGYECEQPEWPCRTIETILGDADD